ncbi:unnamed protein product [Closterium sp. NIES-53]
MVQYRPHTARAGRFSHRAQWRLHLGIEKHYNAWKFFDVHSKETVAARDVIFYERLTLQTYLDNLAANRDLMGGFRGNRAFASAADEADYYEQNVDNASEEVGPLPYCSVPIPMDDENPRESVNAKTYFDFADTASASRPAALRVTPCCSQRVVPCCSQRVALCCPSRRALLQPARRALLPHTSRPAALSTARPILQPVARPARPSRAAQPEPSCPTRAAPSCPTATTAAAAAAVRANAAARGGAAGSAASTGGAGGATRSAGGVAGAGRASGSAGGAAGAGGAGPTTDRGGGFGFLRAAQRRQKSQQETFSPQVLSELFPQRCVTSSVEAAALGASESAVALGASESAAALGASESATALGASESAAALGVRASPARGPSSAEALHTFTLDSGASRCFFCDCTKLTPLVAPVPVLLADPTGGTVVARASTVLTYPTVPSDSLSGLHC